MQRTFRACVLGVLAAAALLSPAPAQAGVSCEVVRVPVAMAAGQSANQTVSGNLCTPSSGAPIDVLVPGGTYSSRYWDWPVNPDLYSFVRKTNNAGRATFAYDKLGTGASTRPLSAALTLASDAFVLHQLIQWVRGRGYGPVTVIGHSLGTMIAIQEAGQYNDINRLVVTGVLHPPGLGTGVVPLFGSFYPAPLDPKFMGKITDLGYLTTQPNSRAGSFYYAATADPKVIADDEASKDLMSATELVDSGLKLALSYSGQVRVPVLVMVGQQDTLVCGLLVNCSSNDNVAANERPYYGAAPNLTAFAVAATGHSIVLHPSANQSFSLLNTWMRSH